MISWLQVVILPKEDLYFFTFKFENGIESFAKRHVPKNRLCRDVYGESGFASVRLLSRSEPFVLTMPRFSDRWVIDRTFFEFVNGGSCSCCGFPHFFPNGVEGMIQAISDFETDAAQAAIRAEQNSPWPPDMREQVWGDRVRLRHKLKKEMKTYKDFWEENAEAFEEWCRSLPGKALKKNLQMPRSEVTERLRSKYGIHSAFGIVLCAVVDQVAHFKDTKYPTDARGQSEVDFEKWLVYDRRGGFTIRVCDKQGNLKEEIFQIWLKRMQSLGGPKLLERAAKKDTTPAEEEDGGADEVAMDGDDGGPDPSFRSDRRIVRLMVARYFADQLIKKFETHRAKAVGESAPSSDAPKPDSAVVKEPSS